jgi:hypothetical protein
MTVTDVEIEHASESRRDVPARSPDRAALAYLEASGAAAISIVEGETGCAFRTGARTAETAGIPVHATYWVSASLATAVARRARKLAGDGPDAATATQALALAAADHRTTLTTNDVAIERARTAAQRLDAYLGSLGRNGVLREFNRAFKHHREAATMRGEGFMSYKAAESRLRRALIPMLVNGRTIGAQSLFEDIFR